MTSWHISLVETVQSIVQGDPFWEGYLRHVIAPHMVRCSLHLAILVEPYLQFILKKGEKPWNRDSPCVAAPRMNLCSGATSCFLSALAGPLSGSVRLPMPGPTGSTRIPGA
jgi:hypothetical protein